MCLMVLLVGCAGPEPGTGSTTAAQTRADEPDSTRASREIRAAQEREATLVAPTDSTGPTGPSVRPSPTEPRPLLRVHRVEVDEAEDGRGAMIATRQGLAFDVDGARFPARALDPVLHIGTMRFERYTYPSPGLLRFVAADPASLPRDEPIYVQYGDSDEARTVIAERLELP